MALYKGLGFPPYLPNNSIAKDKNMAMAPLKYVTEDEVKALRKGARQTRHKLRNELIVLMLYKHGLRETELCRLTLDQLDLEGGWLYVKRIKGGQHSTQPVDGEELRLIERYLRHRATKRGAGLPHLFVTERGTQLSRKTVFSTIKVCAAAGGITEKNISPHMLRHGCGYRLINKGRSLRGIQVYLGHRNIQNTVRYTELDNNRFIGFWD